MKISILTIILSFFIVSSVNAQEIINYPNVDTKTYEQYLNKDWKNLVKTGKQSLKKNIDFYYLQVRMGIAYYELRKYPKAVKYFKNAHKQKPNDELIQEYLYYSYLFSGRYADARVLAGSFNINLKRKIKIKAEHTFINAIYFDTKHDINDDYQQHPDLGETIKQIVVANQSYYNISLEHLVGNKITIFHGYSNINIVNHIADNNLNLPPLYEENVYQNEYYFSLNAQIANGFNLSGGAHLLNTRYFAPDPNASFGGRRGSAYPLYNYSENSFATSLYLSKFFNVYKITAGVSVANMNSSLQIQPEINLCIYPLGNSKLYTDSKAIYLMNFDNNSQINSPIFRQSIGINFLKYSWFEPSFTYGNMKNYTSYNAFIANNDLDMIKQKYEVLLNIGLAKGRINLFFKYQYNIKENIYEINNVENYANYVNQSITGGLKLYFK